MILTTNNIILPREVISLLEKIELAGFEAYVVGGAVRDALLKQTVNDYDITTSATPDELYQIFAGYTIIPTGIQHGTITLLIDEKSYEITTFRSECGYSDGRHPDKIEFVRSLKEDLARRDFTINALACDKSGNVIDYFGGLQDLENKIIRCVGNPDERLQEDGLRILRGLRFASQLCFYIEQQTSESLKRNKNGLAKVSKERIRVEFNKMMKGPNSAFLSALLKEYVDIICVFIPELIETTKMIPEISHHDKSVYRHLCNVVQNIETPDYILRIAAYLHDIGKPQTVKWDEEKNKLTFYEHDIRGAEITYNILRRLKYTKEEIEEIVLLVRYHNDPTKVNLKWVKRKLAKFGGDAVQLKKLFILKLADVRDHKFFKIWQYTKYNQLNELVDQILAEDQCFSLKKMLVNGHDMIALGFVDKEIGIALNLLLQAVINEKVENNKEALIKYVLKNKTKIKKAAQASENNPA